MVHEAHSAERVILRIENASWLPNGRAEVVLSETVPRPVALVRVLLHREDEVFCTPREDGRADIPTKRTRTEDPSGASTIDALAVALGIDPGSLRPRGFVRNVVAAPAPDYPWPLPLAHFVVWTSSEQPRADGLWMPARDLRDRHWYPLLEPDRCS